MGCTDKEASLSAVSLEESHTTQGDLSLSSVLGKWPSRRILEAGSALGAIFQPAQEDAATRIERRAKAQR